MFEETTSEQLFRIKDEINSLLNSLEEIKPSSKEVCQQVFDWTETLKDMRNSVIDMLVAELKKEIK